VDRDIKGSRKNCLAWKRAVWGNGESKSLSSGNGGGGKGFLSMSQRGAGLKKRIDKEKGGLAGDVIGPSLRTSLGIAGENERPAESTSGGITFVHALGGKTGEPRRRAGPAG